jgi:opacity protein-like surface antigen
MMKKLILAILILNSVSVFGQFRFGIVATPQLTWMKSTDVKYIKTEGIKPGIAFGLNVEYAFGENAMLTTGIFVNNASGKLFYDVDSVSFEYGTDSIAKFNIADEGVIMTYKNQYLEIPIGLKFKTNDIEGIKYYAQMGLNPLIAIGAKAKSESPDIIKNEKFIKEVSMFALAYHIGAGIEYNLSGNTDLLAGIYYTNGFTDVTRNPTAKKPTNIRDKTILNGISLKVGVLF